MTEKTNKKTCSACGTSPINHRLLLSLNILEETVGRLGDNIFSFTHKSKVEKLTRKLEKILFFIFSNIGIAKFKDDIEKAETGRSKLIWEEARRRGLEMRQLYVLGKPIEFYRAKINGEIFYYPSLPIPPELPQSGYRWIDDKFKLSQILLKAKIPAPKSEKFKTWEGAKKAFNAMQKPVIVKPQNGSRGRHTTTNINTEAELKNAYDIGREIAISLVMQEHLFGSVYRATVINGDLVGFFRADPPQVTGNGHDSIERLIEEKNKNHTERISDIKINEDLNNFIDRQGYKLKDILPEGTTINLSAKTGRMYGGYTEEMLPKVHPKMHPLFKKAWEQIDAPIAGFDLIIEDPTKDPETQRFGIIECNSLPFIDLHYFALEGPKINLAKNIWDLWN